MKAVKNFLKSRLVFNVRQAVNKNTYSSIPQDLVYKYIRIPLFRFIDTMVAQQLRQELADKLNVYTIKQKKYRK